MACSQYYNYKAIVKLLVQYQNPWRETYARLERRRERKRSGERVIERARRSVVAMMMHENLLRCVQAVLQHGMQPILQLQSNREVVGAISEP